MAARIYFACLNLNKYLGHWIRTFSSESGDSINKGCAPSGNALGLVLGVYDLEPGEEQSKFAAEPMFTATGKKYNELVCGKLSELLKYGPTPRLGDVRIFFNLDPDFNAVAVAGMGSFCLGYNEVEMMDEGKEAIRIAAAVGCRALQDLKLVKLFVEDFTHAESAAEGASMGIWLYQELRNKENQVSVPHLELYDSCDYTGWQIGLVKAEAQNLARQLMDTPSNLMTPSAFAQNSVELLCGSGVNIEVKVKGWAESQKMGAFLSVAKGSCEPPVFLELSYYGAAFDERPVVLVGKGITFDSGGVCFKNAQDMLTMRGDMAGAACIVATARAIALLRLPVNLRGLIPLCENMPGCLAAKPGDIVTSMSGKNILVQNTDCEGRLCLADALWYSQNFWPRFVVDIGTFTMDVRNTLGNSAAGVWSNSDELWNRISMASVHTGDRLWRFPLWRYYTKQVTHSKSVDLKNVGSGPGGGGCRAAAFLREFMPCGEWMHIDSFGTMWSDGDDFPYLRRGMSGRPTRTLIEFVSALSCKN